MDDASTRIVVVGGGVIGIACAVALQGVGKRVVLIDRDDPGRGCSYGNAGVIATSFVLPLASPAHILAAPRMLLDPHGPLALRWRDLGVTAPWLARFVRNAAPSPRARSTAALRLLNGAALEAWRELLAGAGERDQLIERGMLDVVRHPKDRAGLHGFGRRLRAEGVAITELTADDVAEAEPLFAGRVAGGLLHEAVAHVRDPFLLSEALLRYFNSLGGEVRREDVRVIATDGAGTRVDLTSGSLRVEQLVIAAGYGSVDLLGGFGARIPMGIEHGYHLMLPAAGAMPSRPVSFHAESFLATPMAGGLRLAGTVELARADAPPNWARADQLLSLARRYLPGIAGEGATRWMGGRPSFPDSLPAIGQIPGAPIFYAFGHQHLGLTQAAITAKCIAALVSGRAPPLPLDAFTLGRFGRAR